MRGGLGQDPVVLALAGAQPGLPSPPRAVPRALVPGAGAPPVHPDPPV